MNRKPGLLALLLAVAVGCGYSHGFIRDSMTTHEVRYNINVVSQRFIKTASGSSNEGSIFCFIPVSGDLYKRAMDDLYAHAALGPNQTVNNLREDHQSVWYLFFFCNDRLTVSGDVVEFTPGPPSKS